mmetsp:Transcript_19759/g.40608  ORF Transcript_19759/g.40608 Transcript_19759/m.40608 type:complete len:254 (+) Transcript_19759:158-919(+)
MTPLLIFSMIFSLFVVIGVLLGVVVFLEPLQKSGRAWLPEQLLRAFTHASVGEVGLSVARPQQNPLIRDSFFVVEKFEHHSEVRAHHRRQERRLRRRSCSRETWRLCLNRLVAEKALLNRPHKRRFLVGALGELGEQLFPVRQLRLQTAQKRFRSCSSSCSSCCCLGWRGEGEERLCGAGQAVLKGLVLGELEAVHLEKQRLHLVLLLPPRHQNVRHRFLKQPLRPVLSLPATTATAAKGVYGLFRVGRRAGR